MSNRVFTAADKSFVDFETEQTEPKKRKIIKFF